MYEKLGIHPGERDAHTSLGLWDTNRSPNSRQTTRPSYHHHHHVPLARISLTLSRHFFLPFIASGRCSGLHPVSSQSCCIYVWAGRPAFARSYVGVHRSTSLMSSSLLLQQCPACLVRLTWIVFVMALRLAIRGFIRIPLRPSCCLVNKKEKKREPAE